jgi:group I intron endonuclease
MENFSLVILEYTDSKTLISCEQKWIDMLKPQYNLNPMAGSSKGYKHIPESLEKIRTATLGRKHSEEVKQVMSESRMGKNNPFFGKTHSEESKNLIKAAALNRKGPHVAAIAVEVTDLETKITTVYDSIRKAADALNSDIKTILRREKNPTLKPYRDRYIINILRD